MFEYRYTTDYKTRYLTAVHFLVFILGAVALLLFFDGGYFLAWFISIMVAIIALMTLSIPHKVVVDREGLDICCISDYTHIPYNEISSVRIVTKRDMAWIVPIFAGMGFFGYYGVFLNIKAMDFVKIYASKWGNFIEITDIYEDKYYISCDNHEELVEKIGERVSLKPNNNE